MVQDCQGNEASEPEEHGQSVKGSDGVDMGVAREEPWSETKVDEDEDGPDGVEDHEIDLVGGVEITCNWVGMKQRSVLALYVSGRGRITRNIRWAARPKTMTANRNCRARKTRRISSIIVVVSEEVSSRCKIPGAVCFLMLADETF